MRGSRFEGGLEVPSLHDIQTVTHLTWAEKLLDGSEQSWKELPKHFYQKVGGLSAFESNVNPRCFMGGDTIKSPFWKKVLESWLHHTYTTIKVSSECAHFQTLANNSNIHINNKHLYLPSLVSRNILRVKDITSGLRFISYEEFLERHGHYARSWMDYNVLFT